MFLALSLFSVDDASSLWILADSSWTLDQDPRADRFRGFRSWWRWLSFPILKERGNVKSVKNDKLGQKLCFKITYPVAVFVEGSLQVYSSFEAQTRPR